MTRAATDTPPFAPPSNGGGTDGWYLYGITSNRPGDGGRDATDADAAGAGDAASCERLACGDLEAVVRRVPLADFSPAALRERLGTAAVLEDMVRAHDAVIATVHHGQPILPAKFGSVYPDAASVVTALRS